MYILHHQMRIAVGEDILRDSENVVADVAVFVHRLSRLPKPDECVLDYVFCNGGVSVSSLQPRYLSPCLSSQN